MADFWALSSASVISWGVFAGVGTVGADDGWEDMVDCGVDVDPASVVEECGVGCVPRSGLLGFAASDASGRALLVCCVSGLDTLDARSVEKLSVFVQSFAETCDLV
jgi:hypothetical protein